MFLALTGPRTFFPLTAASKKQTAVSLSTSEAEIVACQYGLKTAGLPSLELWEKIFLPNHVGDDALLRGEAESTQRASQLSRFRDVIEEHQDWAPSRLVVTADTFTLDLYQDNQSTMRIMITGKLHALRHVKRTHRISVAWISDLINSIQVNLLDCTTECMAADIFTKYLVNEAKF